MSLLTIGRTDIGLYPDVSEEFVPFGIGVILPSFQSVGNMPEEMEKLNNLHTTIILLQVIKAVSLYSDRDRCRSLTFLDN